MSKSVSIKSGSGCSKLALKSICLTKFTFETEPGSEVIRAKLNTLLIVLILDQFVFVQNNGHSSNVHVIVHFIITIKSTKWKVKNVYIYMYLFLFTLWYTCAFRNNALNAFSHFGCCQALIWHLLSQFKV